MTYHYSFLPLLLVNVIRSTHDNDHEDLLYARRVGHALTVFETSTVIAADEHRIASVQSTNQT